MLLDNLKFFGVGAAIGAAVIGAVGFTTGYKLGAGELADLKTRLANQEVKVVTADRITKEIVYQDRIVYQDKVKVVTDRIPFLVEKEVYKNVCLDEEGRAAFNTLMGR
jgi:hypothetical protein